mmetsp:Transcript_50667/g.120462  ORF Transcript_50667/g.120462 Transcript_50667/m.120462 type:complete len:203 (+) Transcript_50667:242-850(+)
MAQPGYHEDQLEHRLRKGDVVLPANEPIPLYPVSDGGLHAVHQSSAQARHNTHESRNLEEPQQFDNLQRATTIDVGELRGNKVHILHQQHNHINRKSIAKIPCGYWFPVHFYSVALNEACDEVEHHVRAPKYGYHPRYEGEPYLGRRDLPRNRVGHNHRIKHQKNHNETVENTTALGSWVNCQAVQWRCPPSLLICGEAQAF